MTGKGLCYIKPCGWDLGTRFVPPTPPLEQTFVMEFYDVAAMEAAYFIDATSVFDWNNLFSTTFGSVDVTGNVVTLNYSDSNQWTMYSAGSGFFYQNSYVTSIVDNAQLCSYLETLAIYQCNTLYTVILDGVTYMETLAIVNNIALGNSGFGGSISLNAVEYIGQAGLSSNAGIRELNLPALTSADIQAIYDNPNLTTFSAPLLVDVPNQFLAQSDSLTSLTLTSAQTLGSFAINTCGAIVTISLPACTTIGANAMADCPNLRIVNIPVCTSCGVAVWGTSSTSALTTIYAPLLADLGGTPGDDTCFNNVAGQTITITVPVSLQTINAGNPDGDLVYLAANNTATINYV